MKWSIRVIGVSIIAGIMYGCASTGENLQRETARSIGGNVNPEQVTISNVDRGATSVKWKASTPSGNYDCGADDMLRRVFCTENKAQTVEGGPGTGGHLAVQGAPGAQPPQSSAPPPQDQSRARRMSIAEAQAKLNALGFVVGKPDGILGPKSHAQLRRFQESHHIQATGELDAATIAQLSK